MTDVIVNGVNREVEPRMAAAIAGSAASSIFMSLIVTLNPISPSAETSVTATMAPMVIAGIFISGSVMPSIAGAIVICMMISNSSLDEGFTANLSALRGAAPGDSNVSIGGAPGGG